MRYVEGLVVSVYNITDAEGELKAEIFGSEDEGRKVS